ncbi:Acyl-CoA dehydrogenase [BD1-7 clade bacterium]|uniref:Acyl-CoA dehydrogenase n=1 Tax=BD1-7 clade bacterium TaxID=2029982 RepID=A0A5S9NKM8_9GAMM|nr:Acyl-CoA dehydrogenase [BD1-7 clade bacterium]CAA0094068.1 Acyl-CoA dehydrogenase [BD1-7 clade bacterium]
MRETEEHQALRRTVSDFVDNEINPHVDEWEAEGIFPAKSLFKKLGNLGLLGISKPTSAGGMGLDFSYEMAAAEELGRVHCGGVPMAIGVQTCMATPAIARFGSDFVKSEYLAPAIAGDSVACIGVSEPGAGSDVAGIKTQARKDGDDYIINGTKMWITNSTQADYICLLANTSDDKPHLNKSLIVVPTDTKGISLSPKLNKLGMRASDTAQIFLEDVRIPQRNLIGNEGDGFTLQMLQFQEERMYIAIMAIKSMELCIDSTIDYTRGRDAFGKPLLDNQAVHFRMAELQTEVEALRSLLYRACDAYLEGENVTRLASMAKLKSGRLSREVTDACLQYWGGMGFMWDNIVSRNYRDMRLGSIGGGADEVMLNIICKTMGILPSRKKS